MIVDYSARAESEVFGHWEKPAGSLEWTVFQMIAHWLKTEDWLWTEGRL